MGYVLEIDRRKTPNGIAATETWGGAVGAEIFASAEQLRDLAGELSSRLEGEVRFGNGDRALYATDASNYRQLPIGVVIPRTADDVVAAVALCRKYRVPILPRGGGTSLAGQTCNSAVLLDFSKYLHRLIALDPEARTADVEPGCILDVVREAAEKHHLTFGPDPATHDHNTFGGMFGNNSCGVHSVMAGRTSDNVQSLEILTYDGLRMEVGATSDAELRQHLAAGGRRAEIFRQLLKFRDRYGALILERYPKIPRRVSGYENLDQLLPENGFNVARALIGTEATCVLILRGKVNLVPSPREKALAVIGFSDIFHAADAVPEMLAYGPIAIEGIDDLLIEYMKKKNQLTAEELDLLPSGGGWLVAEFGEESLEAAAEKAKAAMSHFGRSKNCSGKLLTDKRQQSQLWTLREGGLGATAHIPGLPDTHPGWEDTAVARESLGNYLRDLKALFKSYGYEVSVYGHFGDGLVHCRIPFDLRTEAGVRNWRSFLDAAADLVVQYGGSFSGEHGDGQARAALLVKMYGPELVSAFREFKAIWDPEGRMNPGKVVDPFPITSNLRLGPLYDRLTLSTHFSYEQDRNSFARAMERCVGVGSCRRRTSEKSVMCPSYMATNEERHSTRGRARLLFEMLHGGAIEDLWQSEAVEEALDLCLGCKGCKRDCPVEVDMAKYKAEFRAHHYRRKIRPRAAYSMGLIHEWSRLAAAAPGLANFVLRSPGLSAMAKWAGGISRQRKIPLYARESFVRWFRRRAARTDFGRRVLLFPDTFNNYFRPQTAIAATQLLESLGYDVVIPDRILCCGRPLYDWGMLDRAKSLWAETLDALAPEVRDGTPIIGLEPACVTSFRDELCELFPGDDRAQCLSRQVVLLSEFLAAGVAEKSLPRMSQPAIVHFHCHHHAVLRTDSEKTVLDRIGLDYEVLKSGCCGMAGSFGFEKQKYDIAIKCGERVLLPRVREASPATLILANGFSCREQIEQATGRATLHLAELLVHASRHAPD